MYNIKFLSIILLSLFVSAVFANDDSGSGSLLDLLLVKYPYVHYYDTVYTDKTRNQDGSIYTGGTPVNGYRLIDVRIYEPATGPGNGAPLKISVEPFLFSHGGSSGLYPNVPLEQTTMSFQLRRTWMDNNPQPGTFPLVLMFGGGDFSIFTLKNAEDIAAAGFIVAVPSGYGVDTIACPDCGLAVSRTYQRDGRAVITAATNGLLGFSGNRIQKDKNGIAVVGCVGGSAGAGTCEKIASGTQTVNANSLPNEAATDPRIRGVFAGDTYELNVFTSAFNQDNFRAALGMFASGQGENWSRDFSAYNNASKRIFYDLNNSGHLDAALATETCDVVSEYNRIYQQGVNTNVDDENLFNETIINIPYGFEHCAKQTLTGFQFLPSSLGLSGTLAALLPDAPLSGISDTDHNGAFNVMGRYYVINFLRSTLNNDPLASVLSIIPVFPSLLNNIYVNAVPGIVENDFNLQNKQIDFKPIAGTSHYKATISNRSGHIADPASIPGAYNLGSNFNNGTMPVITAAFNFPMQNGNIPSSNSFVLNPNGYLSLESSISILDGVFAAPRLSRWFQDHGAFTIAILGNFLCNNDTCSPPTGDAGNVWVSSTSQRLQITFYQIYSFEFGSIPAVSAQCTLFPDGSIRLEYDDSFPLPGIITDDSLTNGAVAVGISNGHLRVDRNGNYNPFIQPQVVSFTDIMNSKSTNNADAIFEIYTQGVSAVGH